MRFEFKTPFATIGAVLLAAGAQADTIYLTNGDTLEDVKVKTEGLDMVSYSDGGKTQEVKSDEVLRVKFSKKPTKVDTADSAFDTEAYFPAINDLQEFLTENSKSPKKFPWANPYALYRVMEINLLIGEYDEAIAAADRLVAEAGKSRYVPLAHLGKARALFDAGKAGDAVGALGDLKALASSGAVGNRWSLEADVHEALFDTSTKGDARAKVFKGLVTKSGRDFPIVANRARVAVGEAYLGAKNVDDAEKAFQEVLDDPQADDRTLAGAYSGLGDCLYARGESASGDAQKDFYRKAVEAYMRVVVVYDKQFSYVPHTMLYAGLAFRGMGDDVSKDRASEMLLQVRRRFPGTREAEEAKSLR